MGPVELSTISRLGPRYAPGGDQEPLTEIGVDAGEQATVLLHCLKKLDGSVDVFEEGREYVGIWIGWILHGRET